MSKAAEKDISKIYTYDDIIELKVNHPLINALRYENVERVGQELHKLKEVIVKEWQQQGKKKAFVSFNKVIFNNAPILFEFMSSEEINRIKCFIDYTKNQALSEGISHLEILDINQQDKLGNTVLHQISVRGKPSIVELLLDNGAGPSLANSNGATPLHAAVLNSDIRSVQALLSKGADPNAIMIENDEYEDEIIYENVTPLHKAVAKKNLDIVKVLVEAGADTTIKMKIRDENSYTIEELWQLSSGKSLEELKKTITEALEKRSKLLDETASSSSLSSVATSKQECNKSSKLAADMQREASSLSTANGCYKTTQSSAENIGLDKEATLGSAFTPHAIHPSSLPFSSFSETESGNLSSFSSSLSTQEASEWLSKLKLQKADTHGQSDASKAKQWLSQQKAPIQLPASSPPVPAQVKKTPKSYRERVTASEKYPSIKGNSIL